MKTFFLPLSLAITIIFSVSTNAELVDNSDGTVTQTRDDGSRLMWLKDANYGDTCGYRPGGLFADPLYFPETQTDVQDWIDHINSLPNLIPGGNPGYAGYNDWRLPSHLNRDGSPCSGFGCSENELGYMYYTELGNAASETGGGLTNAGPFVNLMADFSLGYWETVGCFFIFDTGEHAGPYYYPPAPVGAANHYVWLVRDMDPIQLPDPPKANAGADQMVFDEITLDGVKSIDPDGTIRLYEWELIHRGNAAYNKTASGETPTVSDLEPGFYDVVLTVTDDDGQTGTDTMTFGAIGRKGDLDLDGDIDGSDLAEFSDVFGSPF